ncbi:SRPBCC family protein [Pseudomonas petrae]|uniref:SRPBCC family protein n=1 Tax=Pseudomonas petrae TaxID=2912190 RepID=A0ABS9I667_9PSED|nr:SRPBCC family protein [Pseudomonas petrae]MCF7534059.1 SRPBCC family protein [Pseudomonas petrae]MCF7538091.1 SRPBCC family protein [Pseudomonas petrae]MCF7543267.1 SRPBCC family protein [Pseudomonas petrae]MCF7555454.1 SRPBCC family protein [Pseudomonas petrae]
MNAIQPLNTLGSLSPDTLITNPGGEPVVSAISINAPAREVWKVVGDFGGFTRFIPELESIEVVGEGPGSVRYKKFKEGGLRVVEQLNSHDDDAMAMTWTTIYNNLGVSKLWASMTVFPKDSASCVATWTIVAEPTDDNSMDAEGFREFLQGFADGAMKNVPVALVRSGD